jgi:hypothetical protein
MPRNGGLFGAGGLGRQVVEAAAKRTLGVDLDEETTLREQLADRTGKLVEAVADARLADRLNRRMGFLLLNAAQRLAEGQDAAPDDRFKVSDQVRAVVRRDSHMLYGVRLRNAFCWGRGVTTPKANDEEVQVVLNDLWDAAANKAELTSPDAQWRAGKDLWEVCNVYTVVFADGLDGRVLLAGLQHDQVRFVVRDPKVWRRVLWYGVTEYVYEFDFAKDIVKPNPKKQIVYYEALDGFAELEEELEQGRAMPTAPPASRIRPGRVLHVAINRGRESAFGEPELRTNLRWAAAFNDLAAGQVEKAKAAQSYLMKVTAQGASTEQQLTDTAIRAVTRKSPLATSFDGMTDLEDDARGAPARPGAAFWGNEALRAEPLNLDSGSGGARLDMQSASQAYALGTNFPGHYFFGDPGSLAGSMAVELPVLKLTDIDQEVWEGTLRKLCDLRIARAIKVGILDERRDPTDDEIAAGIAVEDDGKLERDLTYEIAMPEPLRRNLPELMQLVVDTATTFDPTGSNEPIQRSLLGFVLAELFEMPDTPALVERIFAVAEQQRQQAEEEAAAQAEAEAAAMAAANGNGAGGAQPRTRGPDDKTHPTDNPLGARRTSKSVEAAQGVLWQRLQDPDDPLAQVLAPLVEAWNIPNAFGRGAKFGIGGRFRGKFHPGRNGAGDGLNLPKIASVAGDLVHRIADKAKRVKAGENPRFPNAAPRVSDDVLERYQAQQAAYAIADPGREAGADEAWMREAIKNERDANKALNVALGPDLAKYIDRKWGKDAGIRAQLLNGEIDVEEAEELAYEEYQRAESKRLQREVSRDLDYGLERKPIPCFSCGRFKRRPSDICHYCGDDPVQLKTSRHDFDRAYGYAGHDVEPEYGHGSTSTERALV